ncbi:unnamed protein product [Closterium sp. NIES-54]
MKRAFLRASQHETPRASHSIQLPHSEATCSIPYKAHTCSNNGDARELAVGQPFRPALEQRAAIAVVAAGTERVAFVTLSPFNAVSAFNAFGEFSAFSTRASAITVRHGRVYRLDLDLDPTEQRREASGDKEWREGVASWKRQDGN